jgi:hypothetical protein
MIPNIFPKAAVILNILRDMNYVYFGGFFLQKSQEVDGEENRPWRDCTIS